MMYDMVTIESSKIPTRISIFSTNLAPLDLLVTLPQA